MKATWLWLIAVSNIAVVGGLEWTTSHKFDTEEFWVVAPFVVWQMAVLYLTGALGDVLHNGKHHAETD